MAISIDFLANVGQFLKRTEDVEGALEDVGGSLDDLARTAQRQGDATGDHLGRGIGSGTDDAESALRSLSGKLDGIGDTDGPRTAGQAVDGLGEKLDGIGQTEGPAQAGQSVDGLADKLSALAKSDAGAQAGDELRDGVRDGGAQSERAVDGVTAKFSDLAARSAAESSVVGTNLSHSVKKGTDEANEGIETLKENTGSNLKEVAASFDGSFDSIAGGAQGLVAEILEGFGPAGLIAGAVAAGGIGLIINGISGAKEKSDELKGKVEELASTFLEVGSTGKRSIEGITDTIKGLATSQDDQNLTKIWKDAQSAGLDYKGVVAALASANVGEIEKERLKIGDLISQQKINGAEATTQGGVALEAYIKNRDAAGRVSQVLKDQQDIARDAGKAQAAAAAAGLTEYGLKQKAIEQLHDAYADAAGEVDKYIDKESGIFDVEKYLRAMEKREDALRDYQDTLLKSSLSPEARDYIESQGADQAAALVAGYAKASEKQQDKLNDIWSRAGRENANTYGDVLGKQLQGKSVDGPSINPASTAAYQRNIEAARAKAQKYLNDNPLIAGAILGAAAGAYGKVLS